ncbi:hypothetical protein NEPAR04_2510 [Nematocida parisii]|nr:hypothetical protein NEPAR04_2510 [Nematocida parisii]
MQSTDITRSIQIKKYVLGALIVTLTILATTSMFMYALKPKEEQQSQATQALDPCKKEAEHVSKEAVAENPNTGQTDPRVLIQLLQERMASDEEKTVQLEEEIEALKETINKQENANALFMANIRETDADIEEVNTNVSELQKILHSLVLDHEKSIIKLNNFIFGATGVPAVRKKPEEKVSVFNGSQEEEEQPTNLVF